MPGYPTAEAEARAFYSCPHGSYGPLADDSGELSLDLRPEQDISRFTRCWMEALKLIMQASVPVGTVPIPWGFFRTQIIILQCEMLALRYVGSPVITGHISHPGADVPLGLGRDGQDPKNEQGGGYGEGRPRETARGSLV